MARSTSPVLAALAMFAFVLRGEIAQARNQPTILDDLVRIGRIVPGFGGMYVDEERHTLFAYMVPPQPDSESRLDSVITRVLASRRPAEAHFSVLEGRFTLLQLKQLHDHLSPRLLVIPGVVLTGIDLARNRVRVGVATNRAMAIVTSRLRARIQSGEVDIERMSPINDDADVSLQDEVRPLIGGLRIFPPVNLNLEASRLEHKRCTLGAVAERERALGFITASHCADFPFDFTEKLATTFSQISDAKLKENLVFPPTIGKESVNPPLQKGLDKCPDQWTCRFSDSLFATVDSGITVTRGLVAKPSKEGDPAKWNGKDAFRIVAANEEGVVQGAEVVKVGGVTGLTKGKITQVCANVKVEGKYKKFPKAVFLCLHEAEIDSTVGDSGAPFLLVTNKPHQDDVVLIGLLKGGEGKKVFFSGITHLQGKTELGTLKLCADGFNC